MDTSPGQPPVGTRPANTTLMVAGPRRSTQMPDPQELGEGDWGSARAAGFVVICHPAKEMWPDEAGGV